MKHKLYTFSDGSLAYSEVQDGVDVEIQQISLETKTIDNPEQREVTEQEANELFKKKLSKAKKQELLNVILNREETMKHIKKTNGDKL